MIVASQSMPQGGERAQLTEHSAQHSKPQDLTPLERNRTQRSAPVALILSTGAQGACCREKCISACSLLQDQTREFAATQIYSVYAQTERYCSCVVP